MAKATEVAAPLADRTLAHGRNVMAVAGVIVVLAWVPYIEITSFKPLGFDIKEGGELSVWGVLAAVLFYYAIRFCADCWTDYNGWRDSYRGHFSAPPRERSQDEMFNSHARRLNRKFWVLDVAPPALMFLVALVAAYLQIARLVKPLTPT